MQVRFLSGAPRRWGCVNRRCPHFFLLSYTFIYRTRRVHHAAPVGYGTSDPTGTPNKYLSNAKQKCLKNHLPNLPNPNNRPWNGLVKTNPRCGWFGKFRRLYACGLIGTRKNRCCQQQKIRVISAIREKNNSKRWSFPPLLPPLLFSLGIYVVVCQCFILQCDKGKLFHTSTIVLIFKFVNFASRKGNVF